MKNDFRKTQGFSGRVNIQDFLQVFQGSRIGKMEGGCG